MSIDTLRSVAASLAPLMDGDGQVQAAGKGTARFAKLLDGLSSAPESLRKSPQGLASMAHLTQLQMLHSLFVDEEDNDDNDSLFTAAQTLGEFSLLQAQKSQYIDKYCAHQRPSVQLNQPQERQDIDRLIDQVAEKVSLAPALIHSVVATESAYRTDAISPVGAQGLMQLMPETAKELGVTDSFNAHENLLGGSRYLKQLLDKYDGDLDHALAAYNWGQGNVDRHGLAKMPAETRNYLARVKSLLGNQAL